MKVNVMKMTITTENTGFNYIINIVFVLKDFGARITIGKTFYL